METELKGGELMDVKYDPVGEISIRGRAAKIVLDPQGNDPVRFFCFAEDLEKLLDGKFSYVKVFRDAAPADRFAEPC